MSLDRRPTATAIAVAATSVAILACLAHPATIAAAGPAAPPQPATTVTAVPGLDAPVRVIRDVDGIAHLSAVDEHDLYLAQGWIHAADRLFQMDLQRRQPSGTLAELFGAPALGSDVQLRTLGLRRAAEASLPALAPATRAALEAYAAGVNAWVAAHPLPPEYGLLEITAFAPWTPVDSLAIAKLIAFGLSFDLDVDLTVVLATYQQAGTAAGFDGSALFFEDLFRSAPFDPASTVPDAAGGPIVAPAAATIAPGAGAAFRLAMGTATYSA
jgi:penicillin amidase